MSDLIERLRAEAEDWDCPRGFDEVDMHGLLAGAADYITTLEAKLAVAREALGRWRLAKRPSTGALPARRCAP